MKSGVASGRWPLASAEKHLRHSAALALRAPEGFQLRFERRPISAVFSLFGAGFGIERCAQGLALARQSEVQQRAAAGYSASFAGESLGQLRQQFGGPCLSQPELDPIRARVCAVFTIVDCRPTTR